MDYTNYKLNDKVAKAIAASTNSMPFADGVMSKQKGKRPSLPLRKRSSSHEEGESPKPSSAAAAAMNAGVMGPGMMSAFDTPLQRLYASQEGAAPHHMPGSPGSRSLPPFILTGYQAGGGAAGRPRYPAPGSFPPAPAEDEVVARQLAALARPNPSELAAASASRVSGDAALMARAMVMESERRRHHALMHAQAQAVHAQAAHAQAAQAQAMSMGMPPAANPMGSDTDILAAIQQRQRFLGRLEVEFKAKMAARGGPGGL